MNENFYLWVHPILRAASLKAMTDAGLDVVGVVSQPDRPKGRGHKLVPTDVKAAALEAGIENIYQPEKLRNGELQPVLDKLKPELIVVVAYGKFCRIIYRLSEIRLC